MLIQAQFQDKKENKNFNLDNKNSKKKDINIERALRRLFKKEYIHNKEH